MQVLLPQDMWDLSSLTGAEPESPELQGRFLTPGALGKSPGLSLGPPCKQGHRQVEGRLAPQMWGPCLFVSGACRHRPQLPVTSVPSRRNSRFGGNGTRSPGRAHVAGEEASPFPSNPGAGRRPGHI